MALFADDDFCQILGFSFASLPFVEAFLQMFWGFAWFEFALVTRSNAWNSLYAGFLRLELQFKVLEEWVKCYCFIFSYLLINQDRFYGFCVLALYLKIVYYKIISLSLCVDNYKGKRNRISIFMMKISLLGILPIWYYQAWKYRFQQRDIGIWRYRYQFDHWSKSFYFISKLFS